MRDTTIDSFRAGISHLLPHGSPLAVSRLVVAVVVNALDSHVGRTRTHVISKQLEAIPPSLTYADASCAIVFISFALGIVTALFHAFPDMPKSCMGEPVLVIQHPREHLAHAPTTHGVPSADIVHSLVADLSAIAAELPEDTSGLATFRWPDCYQPTKPLAGNITGNSSGRHENILRSCDLRVNSHVRLHL